MTAQDSKISFSIFIKILSLSLVLNSVTPSTVHAEQPLSSSERRALHEYQAEVHASKTRAMQSHKVIFNISEEDQSSTNIELDNSRISGNTSETLNYFGVMKEVETYGELLKPDLQSVIRISEKRHVPVELSFFILGVEAKNRLNTIHAIEEIYSKHVPDFARDISIAYDRNFWTATVGPGGRSPLMLCELYSKNYIRAEFDKFLDENKLSQKLTAVDRFFLMHPDIANVAQVSGNLSDAIRQYIFTKEGGFEVSIAFAEMVGDEMGFDTIDKTSEPAAMMKMWSAWMEFMPQDQLKFQHDPTPLLSLIIWGVPKPYINHEEGYTVILLPVYKKAVARAQELLSVQNVDLSSLDRPIVLQ